MAGIDNTTLFSSGDKLTPSSAQDIARMQVDGTDVGRINHAGNPEGVVSANPASLCHDTTSGTVFVKQIGTGNTGWVPMPGVSVISSMDIDFLDAGAVTALFTTAARPFFIIGFGYTGIDVSGVLLSGFVNYGWTAPDYNDFLDSVTTPLVNNTDETAVVIPPGGPTVIVPPSTTFRIKIGTATTATTDTEKVSIMGFYI